MRGPSDIGDELGVAATNDTGKKSYPLAKIPNNVSYETVSDQPEAEPNQPVAWPLSFHGGVAYSKYDPRNPGATDGDGMLVEEEGVIRPGIAGTLVVLTNAANPPNYSFETVVNDAGADDGQPVKYIIANEAAEINVYKISLDSGDFGTLLNTKTFAITPTQPCGHPAEWNDGSSTRWYLGLGDNGKIQRLDSVVSSTAADTWTASADADARHLKVVGNRLNRSTDENQISILPRGSDPMSEANWGGDFFVGDVSANVTELGEASGLGYQATEKGLYEWDLEGEAENVFPEIGEADRNGQGMIYWHGGFLIPAVSLWWTRTGKPIGPDSNPNNRANHPSLGSTGYLKHGRWMGLDAFGEYVYGLYLNSKGTQTTLLYGRERDSSDPPGWGPIVWHTLSVITADDDDFHGLFIARTSEHGASDIRPSLWVPVGNNVGYYWLDKDGAPMARRGDIDLNAGNSIETGDFDFGYPAVTKQLHYIDGWAEDLNTGHSFTFKVYRDGGSIETVGSAVTSDGYFQEFWTQDTNDTARSMLVQVSSSISDNTTDQNGPHLRDVTVRGVLMPRVSREWTFLFDVADQTGRTAKKIRSELEGYVGDLKKYRLPDRDTFNGVMGKPRMLRADEISALTPRNQEPPHYVIAASVREMAGS